MTRPVECDTVKSFCGKEAYISERSFWHLYLTALALVGLLGCSSTPPGTRAAPTPAAALDRSPADRTPPIPSTAEPPASRTAPASPDALSPTPTTAPGLTRGPYLGGVSGHAMTILWRTAQPEDSRVDYGLTEAYGEAAYDPARVTNHVISLTNLSPGAAYSYRVSNGGFALASSYFRTSPPPSDPNFTFVAFGDSGSGGPNQYAVAALANRLHPDIVIHTGDVVYPSGAEKDMDPTFFQPYRALLPSTPFFTVLGNHDYVTGSGAPYLSTFLLPSNNPAGNSRYYSFDYGSVHWIALDSNQSVLSGSAQRTWLEKDLAATQAFWKIAFFHHPPYSSGQVHGSDMILRDALGPLLERFNVDLVLNGHEHNYERTTPRHDYDPAGRGVVYVVTGAGGYSLYGLGRSSFTAASASVYHVVRGSVSSCRLSIEAIEPDDKVFDRYLIDRC